MPNPFFTVHEGDHQRPHDDRRPGVHQLLQLQLHRHVAATPHVDRGHPRGRRHVRHERLGQPAGLRREAAARPAGARHRRLHRHRRRHRLRRRPLDQRVGHRPPVRPRRPDPARRAVAQQHHAGRHPQRRPAPAVPAQRLAGPRENPQRNPPRVSPRADRRRRRLQHGRRLPRPAASSSSSRSGTRPT